MVGFFLLLLAACTEFAGFKIIDEKEEFVTNLNDEIPKVTLFGAKLVEHFFEGKKVKFYIVHYKNGGLDKNERCQIIEKMFSQTKSIPPKKKKKRVKVEPVEKVVDTNQNDAKQNSEDGRKLSTKMNGKKSRQSDPKIKSSVNEAKVVPPPEPEVVTEPDKESSEDEVKLVDTIKPLKEELKFMDSIGLYCMDDYHSTLFVEKYFKPEFEAGKYKQH